MPEKSDKCLLLATKFGGKQYETASIFGCYVGSGSGFYARSFSMSALAQGVTPSIGFVYQVADFSEIDDAGAYQYSFVNRQIYRDFAVMSSLGVRVIKIPISISAVIDPGSAANNNWANQR